MTLSLRFLPAHTRRARPACRATIVATIILTALLNFPAAGDLVHVDDDAPSDPGPRTITISDPLEDGSAVHPFDAIQEALDAATDGDVVLVAPGAYPGSVTFHGKAVHVLSERGPSETTIDGGTSAGTFDLACVRFIDGEGPSSIIEGFTITNGNSFNEAGGVHCRDSTPTIRGNIITGNDGAASGGGIGAMIGAAPLVIDNIISHNSADGGGGGMMALDSGGVVVGNSFSFNEADLDPGGAIRSFNSTMHIENNSFHSNASFGSGGAIAAHDSDVRITRNIIVGNLPVGSGGGGGIGVGGRGEVEIDNCIIADNEGGSLHVFDAAPVIRHCTIAGDDPMLLLNNASPIISNSIVWQFISVGPGSGPLISFSDVLGGWPGAGNINADPQFVDPRGGDWHILPISPCRDAGDPSFRAERGEVDIDGQPRVIAGRVDIGADELTMPADLNGDGDVDGFDLAMLLAAWGSCPRTRACPADLNGSGGVNGLDLAILLGQWG